MGTLTITTTAAQDARIVTAIGRRLGLTDGSGNARDATAAEVKEYIRQRLIEVVLDQERNAAAQTAANAVTPINPS